MFLYLLPLLFLARGASAQDACYPQTGDLSTNNTEGPVNLFPGADHVRIEGENIYLGTSETQELWIGGNIVEWGQFDPTLEPVSGEPTIHSSSTLGFYMRMGGVCQYAVFFEAKPNSATDRWRLYAPLPFPYKLPYRGFHGVPAGVNCMFQGSASDA